ncbi:MAG TPA: hypothetical protein VLQ93_07115 [Myxococcaceae bacterium]|nr:hypothetical protein [Myxococcaceae bacterium]
MSSSWKVTTADGREVVRLSSRDSAFESDVLALRSTVYGRPASECRDEFDEYSDHYVLYSQGVPHYASRVTRAALGPIDCEAFYPQQLFHRFRERLSSSGRFLRNPSLPSGREQVVHYYIAVWRDLIDKGIRVDIGNVTRHFLRYQSAFGYTLLEVPPFHHPVFGTESYTVVLTVDPENPGYVPASFPRHIDGVVRLSDLGVPCVSNLDAMESAA